jgi:hypothetical protein
MESELANNDDQSIQISRELETRIATTSSAIKDFLASNPPRPLAIAISRAETLCRIGATFNDLKVMLQEKRYLEAKDILDDFSRFTDSFGPETIRVIAELRRSAIGKIDRFTRLREEAKLLAGSGKKPEALEKFEAAYSVIPDSDVAQRIAQLRRDILAAAPEVQ